MYIVQNFAEKFCWGGVQVHYSLDNICGLRNLFSARFMPANRSTEPPAGIISFLSTLVGGEEGIRTLVGLLPNGFQDRLVMTASIPLRLEVRDKRLEVRIEVRG